MIYIHFTKNHAYGNTHSHILQYINHIHPDIHVCIRGPADKTGPDDVFTQSKLEIPSLNSFV